jgi:uncharacterized protein
MAGTSIRWRRLDTPGQDACCLEGDDAGWRLQGLAVFGVDGIPARLTYHVACDLAWHTRVARVYGSIGVQSIDISIARTPAGLWTLNAAVVSGLDNCIDVDLGFTPATNLLPIRRLALAVGEAADSPAAWFDISAGTLQVLPQRYERRSAATYWYEAPTVHYQALLEVSPSGFILRYPGLWEAEQ